MKTTIKGDPSEKTQYCCQLHYHLSVTRCSISSLDVRIEFEKRLSQRGSRRHFPTGSITLSLDAKLFNVDREGKIIPPTSWWKRLKKTKQKKTRSNNSNWQPCQILPSKRPLGSIISKCRPWIVSTSLSQIRFILIVIITRASQNSRVINWAFFLVLSFSHKSPSR